MNHERRVLRATGFVPVEAKLRSSGLRDGCVLRGQIVDRLLDTAEVPVVLVTAPPGYGKTTLVAQWADEDSRPFAWLNLDDSDNDPIVLFTYVLLALQRIDPVDAGILATLTGSERSISDVALPRLGRMLAERRRPFVLVLDGRCPHITSGFTHRHITRRSPAGGLATGRHRTVRAGAWLERNAGQTSTARDRHR